MFRRSLIFWAALAVSSGLLVLLLTACGSGTSGDDEGDGSCATTCPVGTTCRDGKCVRFQDGDYTPPDGDNFTDGDTQADADTTDGDAPTDGDAGDGDDDGSVDGDAPPDGDTDGDLDYDVAEPDLELDYTMKTCLNNSGMAVPAIKIDPNRADFGSVPIGDSNMIELEMCNSGGADLSVTSLQFTTGTSPEFFKFHDELPLIIPPGYAAPVYLIYVPVNTTPDEGELLVLSDDPNASAVHVPLISAIKPTPLIEAVPSILQFAGQAGDITTKVLKITNIGLASTTVSPLVIQGGASSPYRVMEVVKNAESPSGGPWNLEKGAFLTATVRLTMGEQEVDDVLIIPWVTDTGMEETRVTLTTSDQAICAQPEAGPDQTVRPLDTVYLDGSMSTDANGAILAYKWEWETKPNEAFRAIIKDSRGNSIQGIWTEEAHPNFYAELAGTYVVKLTLKDADEGCTELNEDTVTIIAVPDETIHIQLMWSQSGNDHDLHLIRPGGHHSRDCSANDTDCCWQNCDTKHDAAIPCPPRGCPGPPDAPDWGQTGNREDDATLDIDDIPGRGPENINLSLPELGDYLVTVENYSGDGQPAVTVRIWLFGVLMATIRHPDGYPPVNHWKVCWLKVHSPTDIEIVPINTIEPSTGARGPVINKKFKSLE
ncbi:MAG: hypothetical protein C4523_12325 [Myxococcales bacterium]|nr:MAG: hypothetical protein C4523_12325 [Myxococcales bacterium]